MTGNPFAGLLHRPATTAKRKAPTRKPAPHKPRAAAAPRAAPQYPAMPNPWDLTGQQIEVLRMVCAGEPYSSIADHMRLSRKRIEALGAELREQMHARNLIHACVMWTQWREAGGGYSEKRIYLSGPMTGLPDLNFPAFNRAAARLRFEGHDVVNPAELDPDPGKPWATYLRRDIRALMSCGVIAMLPGWENSRGAVLEKHNADALGMAIIYLEA